MKCGFCKYKIPKDAKICGHCHAEVEWYYEPVWQIESALGAIGFVLYSYFIKGDHDVGTLIFFGLLFYAVGHHSLVVSARLTRDVKTLECENN